MTRELHGDLAHLGLQPRDLVITGVALALLKRALRPHQDLVTPLRQAMHRDVQIPGDRLQALPPHKPLNRRQLAFRRKALRPTGHGPAVASVMGARRRGRGLRRA